MGIAAFRVKSKFAQRCDKCHRPSHEVYKVNLGQFTYKFCSGQHADEARREYENKTKLGITPNNLSPITDDENITEGLTIDDLQ